MLIGDAVAEYDAGHFQEARALFRQAHEKQPTARTLRGIGMCSFELRDYVEATRALAASLREQRRPLTSEQKRHAEALLARANTFVGRFTVKVKPEGASLFVDGHPADLEPDGVLLLAFGRHQLSLRCPSCSPAEKDEDVDVSGGEKKDIELALAPAPPTPPPDNVGRGRRRRRHGRRAREAGAAGWRARRPGSRIAATRTSGSRAPPWPPRWARAGARSGGATGSTSWTPAEQRRDAMHEDCTSESTIVSQRQGRRWD